MKNSAPYKSFIWLGKDFIEVAFTDKDSSKIEALQSFKKEQGNINRNEALSILQLPEIKNASEVTVGLESNKFTLVPDDLYDKGEPEAYLKSVHNLEHIETVATQHVIPNNCQSVFSLKQGTKALLESEIKELNILHAPSTLLVAYQQILPPNKEFYSFLRVNNDNVTITLFKKNELQLHQSYEIESANDALYYYLNALEVLGFKKENTSATILGKHAELEEIKSTLSENIESARFAKRLPTLQFTDEIFSQPAHRFFNLFALVLCA